MPLSILKAEWKYQSGGYYDRAKHNLRIYIDYSKQFAATIWVEDSQLSKKYSCIIWVSNPDKQSRKMLRITENSVKFDDLFEAKTFAMKTMDDYIKEHYAEEA